ncbi:hypothetical protein BP6252_13367 [Coleophoma cylindrospora]|uniref:Peptidase A1 domain-containing protein n=1 Tax=Coleophoma cylindrospora TaxID=1849047 RepID=A0A3D8QAU1_9HELO|nr:hypothetical protein BP6252_13367 [Coleophoma cylindrospora]
MLDTRLLNVFLFLSVTSAFSISPKGPQTNSAATLDRHGLRGTSGRYEAELCSYLWGLDYRLNITLGSQRFEVLVDTGSAALWVAEKGFNCTDTNDVQNATLCGMTNVYDPSISSTYKNVPETYFYQAYVDGQKMKGPAASEVLGLGGMAVSNLTFGLATSVRSLYPYGYDGIFGFGLPQNQEAFFDQPNVRAPNASVSVPSPLEVAISEGLLKEPLISLSMNIPSYEYMFGNEAKSCNSGQLVLGGTVEGVPVTGTKATVPMLGFNPQTLDFPYDKPDKNYVFYSLKVDSFNFPGSGEINQTDYYAFLDSGTYQNFFPGPIVQAYAKSVSPPATAAGNGYYDVDCKATVPDFSVTIGGTKFTMDHSDIISFVSTGDPSDPSTWVCQLGMVDANVNDWGGNGTRLFKLGQLFQHNVVSTVDVAKKTITLVERQPQDIGSLPA